QAPLRLTVRLRAQRPRPGGPFGAVPRGGLLVAFPDVEPLDAQLRTGALAISVTPRYKATISQSSVPPSSPAELEKGQAPWKCQSVKFYFPFRREAALLGTRVAGVHPAVTGILRLEPHPARFRARCATDVVVSAEQASVTVHLHLEPEVGRPEVVDFCLSTPVPGPWKWKTESGSNQVRATVPLQGAPFLLGLHAPADIARVLALVGTGTPLTTTSLLAVPRRGHWWRLVLDRPLREPLTVTTSFLLPRAKGAQARGKAAQSRHRPQPVPLLTIPAANVMNGEVALYLAGTDLALVQTRDMREVANPARPLDRGAAQDKAA